MQITWTLLQNRNIEDVKNKGHQEVEGIRQGLQSWLFSQGNSRKTIRASGDVKELFGSAIAESY